jgi:isoquinoline 1-oxidoreductase subunit beta
VRRRSFLVWGLGSAGALLVGWSVLPPRQRLYPTEPLPASDGELALNGWVKIHRDGIVSIVMAKQEMGQGIHTSAAMLLAEELDCAWSSVRLIQSPIDKIYGTIYAALDSLPLVPGEDGAARQLGNWFVPKLMRDFGVMMTSGSSSVRDLWQPMREAGAMTRASLVAAAAREWGVAAPACSVEDGVVHGPGGARRTFGEIVARGQVWPAERYPLKDPKAWRLIGRATRRLDTGGKVSGEPGFGIDVRPAGLLYAAVRMSPTPRGSLAHLDTDTASRLPGVVRVVDIPGYRGGSAAVAVIARSYFAAKSALDALHIDWQASPDESLDSAAVYERLARAAAAEEGHTFRDDGDARAALSRVGRVVTRDYRAPYLAHAALEPVNCTVETDGRTATVWAGTQVPSLAQHAVAQVLGISRERVTVHVPWLGGGFGRRLEVDFIAQAAAIAAQVRGAPIQTLWSREEDTRHGFYRPACAARLRGAFEHNRLVVLESQSASQSIASAYGKRALGISLPGPDIATIQGAFDQAYEIENQRMSHVTVDLPLPVGYWRSVGHSHQAFFLETFIDELAATAAVDPVAFRTRYLLSHPRHLAVLRLAAAKANWGTPLAPTREGRTRARGVALHECFGTIVAQVAEVSLSTSGQPRVHRVVCAADCGTVVNPDTVAAQLEGGIVFGLSAALRGQITLNAGRVVEGNFSSYPILRMEECPSVEVYLVPSAGPPNGVGETGVPPIAPAVGNALYALTGRRCRSLPLTVAA